MSEELKEIRLQVGTVSGRMGESDDLSEVKFTGRELANYTEYHGETSSGDDRGTDYILYQTKKDKYLLHINNWSRWQNENGAKKYDIYDSLDELKGKVPDSLIYNAKEELGLDPAEELDI